MKLLFISCGPEEKTRKRGHENQIWRSSLHWQALGHTKKLTSANAVLVHIDKVTNREHPFVENHTLPTSLWKIELTGRVLIRLKKDIMLHMEHSKLFFMVENSYCSTLSCI